MAGAKRKGGVAYAEWRMACRTCFFSPDGELDPGVTMAAMTTNLGCWMCCHFRDMSAGGMCPPRGGVDVSGMTGPAWGYDVLQCCLQFGGLTECHKFIVHLIYRI